MFFDFFWGGFNQMKKEDRQNLIRLSKKIFQKERGILFCYLFGSQTTKNTVSDSDVDLAVFFEKNQVNDFFERRLELIGELSKLLGKEADVVVLNTAPPFLRYVVLKESKLIFERDKGKRIDFEPKSLNEYFDFKPILEKYHQRLLTS